MRHNYKIEDLENIAENFETTEYQVNRKTDVNKYIKHFNIMSGDAKVPIHVIYHHYRRWRKQYFMTKTAFFRQFSKIFDKYKQGGERGYYLNPEPFDLTQEGYFKSRKFLRKVRDGQKRKKEKSQSKSSE